VGVKVGPHGHFLHSEKAPVALDQVLKEHARSDEPACLAAVRLHLKILTVHPFTDGNGRTARLLASMCLTHAGYKSTLLVAFEDRENTRTISPRAEPEPRHSTGRRGRGTLGR
jgi:Fic family protein